MTYLNELKPGDLARIVEIKNECDLNTRFAYNELSEGCFIKIVSCFGNIVIKSNGKTFVISKCLTKKIRVIALNHSKGC